MSAMVERVMRALYDTALTWPEASSDRAALMLYSHRLDMARAAIAAMRNPTRDMDEAPSKIMPGVGGFTARTAWQAMIDAALESE